jgi:hypothetical protein
VNRTAVAGQRYFFINFGSKTRLSHRPIDQFNGGMEKHNVGTYLAARQRKLRRDLSDMVLSLRTYDDSRTERPTKVASEEAEEYDSEDSEEEKDATTSPSVVWEEDTVCINPSKCPNLFKVVPQKCPKRYITALFSP